MGLRFTKSIEKDKWKFTKNETEVQELLERGLKKENTHLTLKTSLFDLISIYKLKERFDNILRERLSYSPNKETAKEEFRKELLESLHNTNNDLAEIRNIGYTNANKGVPLQLIDLGYLFLNGLYENKEEEEVFLNYSLKPLIEFVIEPLAEGVAIAFYLNDIDNNIDEDIKGFKIKVNDYEAHVSFIDEPFKRHSGITDIHERIEAYSNNLVSTNSEIKLSKVTGVEIIDGIEGVDKYIDLIAHSTRELLKNVRLLTLKNDLTAIDSLYKRLETKLIEIKEGILFCEKLPPFNDVLKRFNLVSIKVLKSKDKQIHYVLNEIKKIKPPNDKNENILELTKENLIKCDFASDIIERFLTWDNYIQTTQNNLGTFYASNIENKIYMGIEAHRKIYLGDKENPRFPFNELGLIPEYYELAQSNFLKSSKKRLTSIYNEQTEKQKFKEEEIRKARQIFKDCEAKPDVQFNYKNRSFVIWNDYLAWLNNIDTNKRQGKPISTSHSTKLTAPIIKRFCELCNNSGLDKKDPDETVITYCERICLKFGLEYRDRVRQHFDFNNEPKSTDRHLKKVIELILPRLKKSDRAIIDSYIKPK